MEAEFVSINLLLVRHGETLHNKSQTIAGHQPGKLTELGRNQAEKIGHYFRKEQKKFDVVYVSVLGRTRETYENAMSKASHLKSVPPIYTPLIQERGGGVLENQPLDIWAKNAQKEGKSIRQYKCKGGESWEDVMNRAHKFIELLVTDHLLNREAPAQAIKVLAVTHGGFIMQFHNACNVLMDKKISFDNSAINCSMHEFEIKIPARTKQFDAKKVKIECTRKNFVGHLKE